MVEMLVYIAILMIVTTGSISLLFTLSGLVEQYRAEQAVLQSATAAMERMLLDIRAADEVNVAASTLATSGSPNPGELVLIQRIGASVATTTVFSVVDGAVSMSVNGRVLGPLTESIVSVPRLVFFHYDNGTTETVRVRLQVESTFGERTVTREFYTTAVLNGSYE